MFEIFNEEKKDEVEGETEVSYPSSQAQPSYSSPLTNVFVVSVGGSILVKGKPDKDAIAAVAACLNDLIRMGFKLVLVVGGGRVARDYVEAAKGLGANNFELDELGIRITRANAFLLLSSIDNAYPEVLTDIKLADDVLAKGKTPVFGGLMPGFTTDAVGALLAEFLNATFVNISNVDGIYTADPAAHPSARMYHEMGYGKLLEILVSNSMKPGQNLILDLPAATILKRSGIPAFFLGDDMENVKSAIQGGSFHGTVVKHGSQEVLDGEPEEKPRRKSSRKKKVVKRKPSRVLVEEDDDEEIDPNKIRF